MARKLVSAVKTKDREKYAVWIDREALAQLRRYQEDIGVPVSESIRRAIDAYLETLPKKR
jgi:hypothetical protein